MSLPEFVRDHQEDIIQEFAAFAKTLMPAGAEMTEAELRDHALEMLTAIVEDMHLRQTPAEQHRKSQGHGAARSMAVSGRLHAVDRIVHGYTFQAVLAEFRALRASVLRLYEATGATDLSEVRRFNEAIDEALTESMREFARQTDFLQEREAFILKLTDALRPLDDPTEVKRTATRLVGEQLHVSRVFFADAQDRQWLVAKGFETGVDPLPDQPFEMSTYGDWIIEGFQAGAPLVVSDMHTDGRFAASERQAHLALQICAEVALPLVKGGELVAMLVAHDATPRVWSELDIAVLEQTAERTWATVERARADGALRQAHDSLEQRVRERTSQVQSLFKRLVWSQEEERRRIARDIHDQVGQQMTALRMNLEALRSQAESTAALVEHVERTQELAEELDQTIDFLTWQLRPAALDHLGLSASLQNLVTNWAERFAIAADFTVDGVENVRWPRDVEANLYRIAQEALHNIAKHADATEVTAHLMQQGNELVLLVEDNGRGFDAERRPEDGQMGLMNMRERAALVGGRLDIESVVGHGTSIYVRIPERDGTDERR